MINDPHDPATQWSDLLAPLGPRQRASVVDALRSSAAKGWPADAEAVRLLVAYAMGEIGAQDYAVGILVSMGAEVSSALESSPGRRSSEIRPARPARPDRSRRTDAVADYVAGRIPVE
jgi:hypothetical protein